MLSLVPQAIVNGFALASIFALIALGLTLVFGVLDVVNFAHGVLVSLAGYLTFELTFRGVSFWACLVIVPIVFAAGGALLERGLFAFVRDEPINGLLLSVGLISVFHNVIDAVWGPDQYMVDRPVRGAIEGFGLVIPTMSVLAIAVTVVVMIVLAIVLRRTRVGRAMRATAQNRTAAVLMGIPVDRINMLAFAVGAVLAAVAGVLIAGTLPLTPTLGDSYLVYGFVALIIGGAGSPIGAVIGAVVTGFAISAAQTMGTAFIASIAPFIALIVVLYFWPQGLVRTGVESTL